MRAVFPEQGTCGFGNRDFLPRPYARAGRSFPMLTKW